MSANQAPLCAECNQTSELVSGKVIYPHRPDLYHLNFWLCHPCFAYVGCHPKGVGYGDGTRPLGTPANALTREARKEAHSFFDPVWRTKGISRRDAYAALARALDIPKEKCHIGLFDYNTCKRVTQWAKSYRKL